LGAFHLYDFALREVCKFYCYSSSLLKKEKVVGGCNKNKISLESKEEEGTLYVLVLMAFGERC
jgi:hypothetical protein